MKKDIHPPCREVIFKDISSGFQILVSSTAQAKDKAELEGKTYPLVTFDVSSASHPFYTGQQRLLDTEGRAEKFMKKYKGFGSASSGLLSQGQPAQKSKPAQSKQAGLSQQASPLGKPAAPQRPGNGRKAVQTNRPGRPDKQAKKKTS